MWLCLMYDCVCFSSSPWLCYSACFYSWECLQLKVFRWAPIIHSIICYTCITMITVYPRIQIFGILQWAYGFLLQIVQRSGIVFMPQKYQPDYMFLRHVPLRRAHLFTAIQILCLAVLWIIKQIKSISIVFPLMVCTINVLALNTVPKFV